MMSYWHALILGVVEGITEFLPVSSTGHLTIVSALLGYQIDDRGVTAFTAVIQIGAIIAAIVFFWGDIVRLLRAWIMGLRDNRRLVNNQSPSVSHGDTRRGAWPEDAESNMGAPPRNLRVSQQIPSARGLDYRLAWVVILGSIPIGIVGFALQDVITGALRSLWVVVVALAAWSVVMVVAERVGSQRRGEADLNLGDGVTIGLAQCLALIPGVSRSGATISAGLFRGLDRVTAVRMSFFMAIPALTAAGLYEAIGSAGDIAADVGWGPTVLATLVSGVVGWVAISWLLRFVARNSIALFVWWRLAVAAITGGLILAGVLGAA